MASAAASPLALAHDGGVFAILTLVVIAAAILGIVGGTLSGGYGRRLSVCMGGTLLACMAGIVTFELLTDNAIEKNFWPNIAFLASFAAIPLMAGYSIAHLVGRSLRVRRTKLKA